MSLVVRTCVLEDMNSQCGTFRFENDTMKGCLLTCDFDGCNAATGINANGKDGNGMTGTLIFLLALTWLAGGK